MAAPQGWIRDYCDAYRLRKANLQNYLRRKFGAHDFEIEFRNDAYNFKVPRRLSDAEKEDDIGDLRTYG